ncbi:hypothetical protein BIU82_01895 [Arthrobacter sp. SW1]|uniref:ABC transporter substrate-binding protein n=1 Tax=Arthrobacter sp. SW1 TaxID=1920889 RepID=UPI000877CB32|nr:ABC transporter substrate-binding protein [Arthrobacter sp. SW1]OFI39823.1 hypothetical protein BIU82_01895 [Arthrobacter sp. SW1]
MTPGSERMRPSRRAFLSFAALAPLALAACSSEKKGKAEVTPSDAGFPKTISHRFGSTEVKAPPVRIVALGTVEAETLAALGVVPLSRPAADSTAWYRASLRALPRAEDARTYDDSRELTAAVFKELKPDAFIAVGDRLSRAEYQSLSELAPVILAPDSVPAADWAPVTTFIADVVGLGEAAEPLIAEARDEISASVADYPVLKDASALFVSASSASGSDLVLSGPGSAPVSFFEFTGLTVPAGITGLVNGLKPTPSRFPAGTAYLPRTRAGELSADALVVGVPMSDYQVYRANKKLSPEFPSFGAGTVYVVAGDEAVSLQRQSILGARWAARNVIPELAKSAFTSKNPGTGKS